MRVTELNCGTGRPPGCRLLRVMPREMICRVLLVEADDELLLVDTGLGREDVRCPRKRLGWARRSLGLRLREEETAHARLRHLGLNPDAVGHIVLTHLDLDHVGGLADFPEAQVHILGVEAAAAAKRATIGERFRYRPAQLADQSRWKLYDEADVEPWCDVAAIKVQTSRSLDVRLVLLPGHTRGHCGVAIDLGDVWLLHVGDSYYSHLELDPASASWPLNTFRRLVHVDPRAAARTLDALRSLRVRCADRVRMVCSHDPTEPMPALADARPGTDQL